MVVCFISLNLASNTLKYLKLQILPDWLHGLTSKRQFCPMSFIIAVQRLYNPGSNTHLGECYMQIARIWFSSGLEMCCWVPNAVAVTNSKILFAV